MKTDALSGWLLHQRPSKNTTAQVFFLTRERGMVQAFCAGTQSIKKRAILQPFTLLWLTLNERHYGAYVKQIEIAETPQYLTGENLLAGLYLNELLYRALKPEMGDVRLFDAYEQALNALKHAFNRTLLEVALRRFERQLLTILGYEISYQYEAHTRCPIAENEHYIFLPEDGFILNTQGFLGAHILAIGLDIWEDVAVLKTAKLIMRRAIENLLDGVMIQTRLLYTHST